MKRIAIIAAATMIAISMFGCASNEQPEKSLEERTIDKTELLALWDEYCTLDVDTLYQSREGFEYSGAAMDYITYMNSDWTGTQEEIDAAVAELKPLRDAYFEAKEAGTLTPMLASSGKAAETAEESATAAETNALEMAKRYLDVMPFSYSGLIDQLQYEGFTEQEAAYGADNCAADWNTQAALAAQNYLDIMPFSREGLIDQLTHDGYTTEQAEHGADSVGL